MAEDNLYLHYRDRIKAYLEEGAAAAGFAGAEQYTVQPLAAGSTISTTW